MSQSPVVASVALHSHVSYIRHPLSFLFFSQPAGLSLSLSCLKKAFSGGSEGVNLRLKGVEGKRQTSGKR